MGARQLMLLLGLMLVSVRTAGAVDTRVQLTVAGGWGLVSMGELNGRYIDGFARPAGLIEHHLSSGPVLIGEVNYFLSSRVSIAFGAGYLYSQTRHSYLVQVMDDQGNALRTLQPRTKLSASMVAPHVQVRYYVSVKSAVVAIGAGVAYGEGSAVISSKAETDLSAAIPLNYEKHLSGRGFGYLWSVSASWRVASHLSLAAMTGYRHQVTQALKDGASTWQVVYDHASHSIKLDFSGLYLVAGVTFGL